MRAALCLRTQTDSSVESSETAQPLVPQISDEDRAIVGKLGTLTHHTPVTKNRYRSERYFSGSAVLRISSEPGGGNGWFQSGKTIDRIAMTRFRFAAGHQKNSYHRKTSFDVNMSGTCGQGRVIFESIIKQTGSCLSVSLSAQAF